MHENLVHQFKTLRQLIRKFSTGFSEDALFEIPEGYNNNLAWNLGHLVVTQQLLHYKLSGLPMAVDEEMVNCFRKGTGPGDWEARPDMEQIRSLLITHPEKLEADLMANEFKHFTSYQTSAGVTLNTIDDALQFNQFHEGLHLGYMMAMKRTLNV